ncbi:LysR family transcriptional regulator [Acidomonas methanolica]|uniref:Transcriptional regulator LysR n=1 Tax=Acidomonas methanolica NBRC 104435 TaxID=1231351 RepID=A0A023D7L8_ACIMT|nr:LysR family transcriptional regulator [Acidomonas methanolica]TCS25177.1 LysR family transcriptional regulator [Acidomonas methanolica]GAJ30114.1 transcriptional regulator LysR [Acidomonas methanolica NBRC 104435]GEK99672.1 hypothetical protein AME01nite_21710 [Acidomonas methanolica NBRC 104435]
MTPWDTAAVLAMGEALWQVERGRSAGISGASQGIVMRGGSVDTTRNIDISSACAVFGGHGADDHNVARAMHIKVNGGKKGGHLNSGKMNRPMDLLSALRSFIRVAETGSFSVVSRELHVSQPTISRQILLLENHYGVRLFSRTTRCLTLTDDGRTLLEHAQNVQTMMDDAHLALSQRQSGVYGHIRLGTPTAFGLYLTRHLPALLEQHPELSVELVVSDSFGDIVRDGIDMAIRVGMGSSGTTITRHLADVERVLVGSPDFVSRHPRPRHPNDLLGLSPVVYTYGTQEPEWLFRKGNQEVRMPMHSAFRTNSSEVVHRAVVEGIGVGLMPLFSVAEELRSGRLLRVLPDWHAPALDLHVVYPGPQGISLRRRAVLNFVLSLAADLSAGDVSVREGALQE